MSNRDLVGELAEAVAKRKQRQQRDAQPGKRTSRRRLRRSWPPRFARWSRSTRKRQTHHHRHRLSASRSTSTASTAAKCGIRSPGSSRRWVLSGGHRSSTGRSTSLATLHTCPSWSRVPAADGSVEDAWSAASARSCRRHVASTACVAAFAWIAPACTRRRDRQALHDQRATETSRPKQARSSPARPATRTKRRVRGVMG